MGSQAVALITEAFRAHRMNEVTSFAITQEFPYNVAKDILNTVIREMNRLGSLNFTETKTAIVYSVGVNTYSFATLVIDPKKIRYIRREATNYWGEVEQMVHRDFMRLYRTAATVTTIPTVWTKHGDTLEFNTIPDQDYTLYAYHYKDMPVISATTDTLLIPVADEDIIIENCFEWLGYRLGKQDKASALQAIALKTAPLLADMKQDSGMPVQFPAAF